MRLGLTGKAEQQFLSLLNESGVSNPTHFMNLLINFIYFQHSQEAINYAHQRDKQKE